MITSIENRATIGRVIALGFLLAALIAAYLMLAAKPAHATTTFTVDRNDDPDPTTAKACTAAPNDCSLRGAIVAANAAAGADAITLPAGTYILSRAGANEDAASTGDLDITDELTITGAGARTTSVAGGPTPYDDRIFDNQPGAEATITGLSITGGKVNGFGGGVANLRGDLTLDEVAVKDNTVSGGYSAGGIYGSEGTLHLTDSTVSGNSATDIGGVGQIGGTADITNSTISGNKATRFSGGVVANGSVINLLNSTIVSNESSRLGGGMTTVQPGALVVMKNTIVAGNSIDNCDIAQFSGGIINSQGNNISSDDSCPFIKTTDKQNTDPLLGPLQDNGGPTNTRALLVGSPAIDAGSNVDCPAADQRGVARPQKTACDIGAFEKEAPPNAAPTATDDAFRVKRGKTLTVSAPGLLKNDSDPDSDPLTAKLVSGPTKGTLNLNPDGSFSYKPNVKRGSDSFTYEADDGNGATDEATVTIKVVRRR
jgi:hypothetical protein